MDNMQAAVEAYIEKREQMSPRKAAEHVVQAFGVSAHDLHAAVAASGQLLSQVSRPQGGVSTYRQAAR